MSELFTLSEAATATGKSRVTIRRYLDAQQFPNARRVERWGDLPPIWKVPEEDLVALGLVVIDRRAEAKPGLASPTPADHRVRRELEAALKRVAQLETQVAASNAVLAERAEQIHHLRRQVSALTVSLSAAATGAAGTSASETPPAS